MVEKLTSQLGKWGKHFTRKGKNPEKLPISVKIGGMCQGDRWGKQIGVTTMVKKEPSHGGILGIWTHVSQRKVDSPPVTIVQRTNIKTQGGRAEIGETGNSTMSKHCPLPSVKRVVMLWGVVTSRGWGGSMECGEWGFTLKERINNNNNVGEREFELSTVK